MDRGPHAAVHSLAGQRLKVSWRPTFSPTPRVHIGRRQLYIVALADGCAGTRNSLRFSVGHSPNTRTLSAPSRNFTVCTVLSYCSITVHKSSEDRHSRREIPKKNDRYPYVRSPKRGEIGHTHSKLPSITYRLAVRCILRGGAASYWDTATAYEVARAARDGQSEP
jgi:hypothetical protein